MRNECITDKGLEKILRCSAKYHPRAGWCELFGGAGGVCRRGGDVGQRQVHAAPHDGRSGHADIGQRVCARRGACKEKG